MAAELRVPVFAKDWLEAPILQADVVERSRLGSIGYDLLTTLARRQLMFGQSVILDSVASTASIRSCWRELAEEFGAARYVIECVCSDERVHRDHLSVRQRKIPGWPELEWCEVDRVRSYYEPWCEERLVLDSLDPVADNVARAIRYVYDTAA
jgi:hypothetical protein